MTGLAFSTTKLFRGVRKPGTFATTLFLLAQSPWTPYRTRSPGGRVTGRPQTMVIIAGVGSSSAHQLLDHAFRQVFLLALKPAAQPGVTPGSWLFGICRPANTQASGSRLDGYPRRARARGKTPGAVGEVQGKGEAGDWQVQHPGQAAGARGSGLMTSPAATNEGRAGP